MHSKHSHSHLLEHSLGVSFHTHTQSQRLAHRDRERHRYTHTQTQRYASLVLWLLFHSTCEHVSACLPTANNIKKKITENKKYMLQQQHVAVFCIPQSARNFQRKRSQMQSASRILSSLQARSSAWTNILACYCFACCFWAWTLPRMQQCSAVRWCNPLGCSDTGRRQRLRMSRCA